VKKKAAPIPREAGRPRAENERWRSARRRHPKGSTPGSDECLMDVAANNALNLRMSPHHGGRGFRE